MSPSAVARRCRTVLYTASPEIEYLCVSLLRPWSEGRGSLRSRAIWPRFSTGDARRYRSSPLSVDFDITRSVDSSRRRRSHPNSAVEVVENTAGHILYRNISFIEPTVARRFPLRGASLGRRPECRERDRACQPPFGVVFGPSDFADARRGIPCRREESERRDEGLSRDSVGSLCVLPVCWSTAIRSLTAANIRAPRRWRAFIESGRTVDGKPGSIAGALSGRFRSRRLRSSNREATTHARPENSFRSREPDDGSSDVRRVIHHRRRPVRGHERRGSLTLVRGIAWVRMGYRNRSKSDPPVTSVGRSIPVIYSLGVIGPSARPTVAWCPVTP